MTVTNEWINKMWYSHTRDHYSAMKRSEVPTHAATWKNLENIKLSERSQTQGHILCDSAYLKLLNT